MRAWLVIALVVVSPGLAVAGSVQARLDRAKVSLEDEVNLTISVVGDAEKPELPNRLGADFEVQSSGQANQVQIINGRMSSSTRYTYTLIPRRSGTLTIPAIPVEVDGTRLATEPLEVQVTAGAAPGHVGEGIAMSAELAPATGERESAFVGEQLIYTLRILARVNANCPGLALPDIPNAASYPMGEQRQYRTRVDGEEVSVVEERRAVFADRPGVLEIPAVRLTCTIESNRRRGGFDDFFQSFGGARKVLRSNAVRLSIQALPKPPADFSGMVGEIALETTLSRREARVGDSVTLSMRVHGTADVTALREPEVRLGDSVKIYDDKPTVGYDSSGAALLAERTFQKALVAQREGELAIPAPKLSYFDPRQRVFRWAEAEPLTLRVLPGSEQLMAPAEPSPQPPAPPIVSANTVPSPPGRIPLRNSGTSADWLSGLRLAALLVVPIVVGLFIARRRGRTASPLTANRRAAARQALSRLKASGDSAPDIARVMRDLIGVRVQHQGAALSTVEALDALARASVPAELIAKAHAVLTHCDAVMYGGAPQDVYLRDDAVAFARGLLEGA